MGAGESPKIVALEGEFAMTSGHSQEFKTQAVAQRVGKRLRIMAVVQTTRGSTIL